MKKIILIVAFLYGCKEEKKTKMPEYLLNKPTIQGTYNTSTSHYVFSIIDYTYTDLLGDHSSRIASEIETIDHFPTEDEKYMILDAFENSPGSIPYDKYKIDFRIAKIYTSYAKASERRHEMLKNPQNKSFNDIID
jgi:hypothetical protein